MMQTQAETLVRKQFFISPANIEKLEKLSSKLKGRSAAQIVRDAIDAYDPDGEKENEMIALAHTKVKEALEATARANQKMENCLNALSTGDN
jgi:predicted DNA-binding protein